MRILTTYLKHLLLMSCLLLTACSIRPPHTLAETQVKHPSDAQAWELQGKLAFRSSSDKFSTNLFWLHDQSSQYDRDELTLTTMIGTTVLSLKSENGLASLDIQDKTYTDNNPERLIYRVSGMTIPINKLPLWITGQVAPDDEVLEYNPDGSIKRFSSADNGGDWLVSFMSYQQQSGAKLPRLLQINRADVQIKIQINQWQALTTNLAQTNN
ncbi:lipoprotein insertase outer membrane protein LolB [Shewanella sp. 10N.286.52.B9]|uniref:lipoprotein insertase outer membrane protein LolB n=1 Tax=Shewanella sp. 10N.286.52.B9 TaxID=1880837 RepID=UPI001F53A239|nr:lipoprotein insertase outer membrane protein LolB [Shewanella sp. 10N.286.52.B9]